MTDLYGNRYNGVYPPEYKYNGDAHHGYKTDKEETLFYDFAVQGYDLMISYQDKFYYFMVDDDGVRLSDDAFTAKITRFESGNDVLEHFLIDGKPLIKMIDKLDECEPI